MNTLPVPSHHNIHNPTTLLTSESPQTEATSFSETNSVDSSIISEDGDIITIVTADRVTASVLHADSDASSISVDQEHIESPLCSPSLNNDNVKQTVNSNVITLHDTNGMDSASIPQARTDGSNKKSVRFQDPSHNHQSQWSNYTTTVAPDKVHIIARIYVHVCDCISK